MSDLLSQDEIDALLHGESEGEEEEEENWDPNVPRPIDFSAQERIVRGRMPTLEMVNQRFARHLRTSIFEMLRQVPEISVESVSTQKYGDYVNTLFVPTSINLVKVSPLKGRAFFIFDSRLVFTMVDNFFGSDGRFHSKIEGREFTVTELRTIEMLLERIFKDYKKAWKGIIDFDYELMSTEVNPTMVNVVNPTEAMIISQFKIDLNGGSGYFHAAFPYPMIEPIKSLLDAGIQGENDDSDARWSQAVKRELLTAPMELSVILAEKETCLREIMSWKEGDVVSFEMPDNSIGYVSGYPAVRVKVGQEEGKIIAHVNECISSKSVKK